jgi:hypothetical protein
VANEYKKVVTEVINPELPKPLKLVYIHYDVKAKKKEEKNFPNGLFNHAKEVATNIHFFHIESSKAKKSKIRL